MKDDLRTARPGLFDRVRFLYRLPRMIALYWRLWADERVPWLAKSAPVMALLYVLLPVDFVFDWIPALGQLDDAAVVILALRAFVWMSPPAVEKEHKEYLGIEKA